WAAAVNEQLLAEERQYWYSAATGSRPAGHVLPWRNRVRRENHERFRTVALVGPWPRARGGGGRAFLCARKAGAGGERSLRGFRYVYRCRGGYAQGADRWRLAARLSLGQAAGDRD